MNATRQDFDIILKKANDGDSLAQYEMGCFYEYGLEENDSVIIESDDSLSFFWYQQSAERGCLDAVLRLADFLSEGIGCEQNIPLAIELYLKCIEHGSEIAANNLATVFRDNGDYEQAFEYYQLSQDIVSQRCERNIVNLNVGLCYYLGVGVKKDCAKAIDIFKHIAHGQEDDNSQYEIEESNYLLGQIYLQGNGVGQDIVKAREYLLSADKDGDHRSAQELLLIIGRYEASQ